jgi:hypothetical protein
MKNHPEKDGAVDPDQHISARSRKNASRTATRWDVFGDISTGRIPGLKDLAFRLIRGGHGVFPSKLPNAEAETKTVAET